MIKTGRVVRIFDDEKLAINLGRQDGVQPGKSVSIFAPPVEIEDPETKEQLGVYRHRKATAKVITVGDRFSIVGPFPRREESVPAGAQLGLGLGMWRTPTVTKQVRGHLPIDDYEAKPVPTGSEIRVGDAVEITVDDASGDSQGRTTSQANGDSQGEEP